MNATITFLMKSGREITVECVEGSGAHTAHSLATDFNDNVNFSRLITLTMRGYIILTKEIEAIRFWSPTT